MSLIHDALNVIEQDSDSANQVDGYSTAAPFEDSRTVKTPVKVIVVAGALCAAGAIGWLILPMHTPEAAPLATAQVQKSAPVAAITPALTQTETGQKLEEPVSTQKTAASPTEPTPVAPAVAVQSAPATSVQATAGLAGNALATAEAALVQAKTVLPSATQTLAVPATKPATAAVKAEPSLSHAPINTGSRQPYSAPARREAPERTQLISASRIEFAASGFTLAMEKDDLPTAKRHLVALEESLPSESLTLLRYQAWFALRSNNKDTARRLYASILDRVPNDESASLNLASLEVADHQSAQAQAVLVTALRYNPTSAMLTRALGQIGKADSQ